MNKKIVIAECCQNHNGDLRILKDMIWSAADADADYVKIQTIFADDLSFRKRFEEGCEEKGVRKSIKRPFKPEYERLKKLELDRDAHRWFIEECGKARVKPLTTVFSRGRVREVAKLGWKDIKIASYDCASFPLLEDVKMDFEHLFISTGATFDRELELAARILAGKSFSFLHCVTVYPTPLSELHLARMEFLRRFTPSVGFSDHTLTKRDGIRASAVALHLGADVVERHFTILNPESTKDGAVSMGPEELKILCNLAHGSPEDLEEWVKANVGEFGEMIGQGTRDLSHEELLNRDYYRGRFATHQPGGKVVYNFDEEGFD